MNYSKGSMLEILWDSYLVEHSASSSAAKLVGGLVDGLADVKVVH